MMLKVLCLLAATLSSWHCGYCRYLAQPSYSPLSYNPYSEYGYGSSYAPGGYPYQMPNYYPPGTYYDQRRGVLRPFPGGGVPIIVDYHKRCSGHYVGMKSHPEERQYYYVCKPDCVIFGRCQRFQQFNATSGQCVQYTQSDYEPTCKALGRFPIYSDCHLYYKCDKSMKPQIYSCPHNMVFSQESGKCIPGNRCIPTQIVSAAESIPEYCENKYPPCLQNGVFRSPSDCSLYYTCALQDQRVYLQTRFKCPDDTFYDLQSNACLPQAQVPCDCITLAELVYPQTHLQPYSPYAPSPPHPTMQSIIHAGEFDIDSFEENENPTEKSDEMDEDDSESSGDDSNGSDNDQPEQTPAPEYTEDPGTTTPTPSDVQSTLAPNVATDPTEQTPMGEPNTEPTLSLTDQPAIDPTEPTPTGAPNTELPVTSQPATETTEPNTTDAPNTEPPVTNQPATDPTEPTASDAPITEPPVTNQPTEPTATDAPNTEPPVTNQPTEPTATEAPNTETPVTNQPATEPTEPTTTTAPISAATVHTPTNPSKHTASDGSSEANNPATTEPTSSEEDDYGAKVLGSDVEFNSGFVLSEDKTMGSTVVGPNPNKPDDSGKSDETKTPDTNEDNINNSDANAEISENPPPTTESVDPGTAASDPETTESVAMAAELDPEAKLSTPATTESVTKATELDPGTDESDPETTQSVAMAAELDPELSETTMPTPATTESVTKATTLDPGTAVSDPETTESVAMAAELDPEAEDLVSETIMPTPTTTESVTTATELAPATDESDPETTDSGIKATELDPEVKMSTLADTEAVTDPEPEFGSLETIMSSPATTASVPITTATIEETTTVSGDLDHRPCDKIPTGTESENHTIPHCPPEKHNNQIHNPETSSQTLTTPDQSTRESRSTVLDGPVETTSTTDTNTTTTMPTDTTRSQTTDTATPQTTPFQTTPAPRNAITPPPTTIATSPPTNTATPPPTTTTTAPPTNTATPPPTTTATPPPTNTATPPPTNTATPPPTTTATLPPTNTATPPPTTTATLPPANTATPPPTTTATPPATTTAIPPPITTATPPPTTTTTQLPTTTPLPITTPLPTTTTTSQPLPTTTTTTPPTTTITTPPSTTSPPTTAATPPPTTTTTQSIATTTTATSQTTTTTIQPPTTEVGSTDDWINDFKLTEEDTPRNPQEPFEDLFLPLSVGKQHSLDESLNDSSKDANAKKSTTFSEPENNEAADLNDFLPVSSITSHNSETNTENPQVGVTDFEHSVSGSGEVTTFEPETTTFDEEFSGEAFSGHGGFDTIFSKQRENSSDYDFEEDGEDVSLSTTPESSTTTQHVGDSPSKTTPVPNLSSDWRDSTTAATTTAAPTTAASTTPTPTSDLPPSIEPLAPIRAAPSPGGAVEPKINISDDDINSEESVFVLSDYIDISPPETTSSRPDNSSPVATQATDTTPQPSTTTTTQNVGDTPGPNLSSDKRESTTAGTTTPTPTSDIQPSALVSADNKPSNGGVEATQGTKINETTPPPTTESTQEFTERVTRSRSTDATTTPTPTPKYIENTTTPTTPTSPHTSKHSQLTVHFRHIMCPDTRKSPNTTPSKQPLPTTDQDDIYINVPDLDTTNPVINSNSNQIAQPPPCEPEKGSMPRLEIFVERPMDVRFVICPKKCAKDHKHKYEDETSRAVHLTWYPNKSKQTMLLETSNKIKTDV